MKNFKLINNVVGWLVFIVASIVYIMTIEPTVSFWDCGEFIATAYKMEVGHTPGAPLFMILARFFSLFAGSAENVSVLVNVMSALASSFTILFLFWTITHLAKKIILNGDSEFSIGKVVAVMGSGIVGALAYTFSDTFWFSAVEGEVYATSSLFTAAVFWAIMKWENVAHEKHANRWLILIAYLMGLSIGIHLLNLLAIPAIVFVYYYKKYKPSTSGFIYASLISVIILGVIQWGIIPGVVKLAATSELLFVNSFGMPYNSGLIIYLVLLVGLVVFGIYYTAKKGKVILNTIILCFAVIMIGYSSFSMIVIRSLANPPMDENNPENVFALLDYLNREQYGDRPLFTGHYFNAPVTGEKEGKKNYIKKDGKYIVSTRDPEYEYDEKFSSFFPRMWSSSSKSHIDAYMSWGGIKESDLYDVRRDENGETVYNKEGQVVYDRSAPKRGPTFGQNMRYFISYQVWHMYFRYFMWNFSGRQNDIQGHGSVIHGNWLSGINFIDENRLGPQDNLPASMKNSKARNIYYMLPLLLGMIGLFYHLNKKSKDFFVVLLLFILTGIAIVIYLNQYPYQPRERDYAYAGSFYAFAIWIGIGVLALYELLSKKIPATISAAGATVACFVAVPLLMGYENWDDHDRSGRFTARDFAKNYLESCAPNAILFTNGDNDTFPLWYAQEVEGIRTDVRVCNLSLLNTDWYIDQMKRKAYDSDAVPFSLTPDQYVKGKRDYVPIFENPKLTGFTDIGNIMEFLASDDPRTKIKTQSGDDLDYIPTKQIAIPVDSALVVSNGTLRPVDAAAVLKSINWTLNKKYILKSELMILDLLATNKWKRPVYFAITVGSDSYMKLENYFQLEGLAYRLVPMNAKSHDGQTGRIASDIMYDNLMNKFVWGNIQDPDVYLDENNLRMTMNLRNNFARLADQLLFEGKRDSAVAVLDRCMEVMPKETVPYNVFVIGVAEGYYKAGIKEKGSEILSQLTEITEEELNYYFSLPAKYSGGIVETEMQRGMAVLQEMLRMTQVYGDTSLNAKIDTVFNDLIPKYYEKME
ncbi:MAG: DUF2723 domain-containing protein [Bacteroidota bacterium]